MVGEGCFLGWVGVFWGVFSGERGREGGNMGGHEDRQKLRQLIVSTKLGCKRFHRLSLLCGIKSASCYVCVCM